MNRYAQPSRRRRPTVSLDTQYDPVSRPKHYTSHPSGVEVIVIAEHLSFCCGNAIKYVLRAGLKEGEDDTTDLRKAIWYLNREVQRLTKQREGT